MQKIALTAIAAGIVLVSGGCDRSPAAPVASDGPRPPAGVQARSARDADLQRATAILAAAVGREPDALSRAKLEKARQVLASMAPTR